jgi:rod shape-determining protein MreD
MRRAAGVTVLALLIVVTVTLQVSVFNHFAIGGVAPDLALIVVIAAALLRGPEYAAVVGFAAGLVLDLAPPADHTAGRWALSLVLVGFLTGLAKPNADVSVVGKVVMVAGGAFIGTSVFALTGLILNDPGVSVASVFDVVPKAVAYDVLVTPLVLPLILLAMRQFEPAERW